MNVSHQVLDVLWVMICGGLVFLMQAGFLCVESGLTRPKNTINVAVKNVSDFCVAAAFFWLIGFSIMFGSSFKGIVGGGFFAPDLSQMSAWQTAFFFFQLMFCGTSITIIAGAIAERIRVKVYLLIVCFVALVIYPVFGHWVWGGVLEGEQGWLKALGFVDFAGSTVVHSLGGWVALALLIIIGPRRGRFEKENKIHSSNIALAMFGILLLWLGWMGFNGGGYFAFNKSVPAVIGNTVISGAAGLIAMLIYSLKRTGFVEPEKVMMGALAGLVAITANCSSVNSYEAFLVGVGGAFAALSVSVVLKKFKIDDAVNAVPIHLGAGIWGTLAVALFGLPEVLKTGHGFWMQLFVQFIGIFTCFVWGFVFSFVVFKLVHKWRPLRISLAEENDGLNLVENNVSGEISDILRIMKLQAQNQDLVLKLQEDSDSEIRQIAVHYNKVLKAFREAVNGQKKYQKDLENRGNELEAINRSLNDTKTAMLNVLEDFEAEKKHNELILKSAGEGIYGLDLQGRTTFVNPSALKMLGYEDESELIGKPQHAVIHHTLPDGTPYPREDCPIYKAFIDGQIHQIDTEVFWRKDGSSFEVEYISTPISEDGQIVGAVVSFVDVSERKRLQLQLQQSQKMEAVGNLAGGIAHDFNNLLMVISGYCEFLLDDLQEEDSKYGDVSEICKAATRGRNLVSQLLAFGRKQISKPKVISLNEALADLQSMLERLVGEHIELAINKEEKLKNILMDPVQLEQVLVNMVLNAKDAIGVSNGKISLKTFHQSFDVVPEKYSELVPGDYACLKIEDDGSGMSKEVIEKIFDPFFTTKSKGKGTGLGLATAFGIIKQNKGWVYVDSCEGQGTTFVLFFPPVKTTNEKKENSSIQNGEQDSGILPGGMESILLVEDEPSVREVIAGNLRNLGYQVREAENGVRALEEMQNNERGFDLVLTDVVMPKMNGADFWQKASPDCPGTKFVFMSGYTDDEGLRKKIEEKKAPFLQKPFSRLDLAEKIREVLEGKVKS